MKKFLVLFLCLITVCVKAQHVTLPPDEVNVVEHVMQDGETINSVWEDYGQKFILKEYKKYNKDTFIKKGSVVYIPVHTTSKEFLTKEYYNQVLEKYSSSTDSNTTPAGTHAEATITKLKLSPYNGEEFHMYLNIKANVKWLGQKRVGYRYIYYDGSHKKELYSHGFTLTAKKDDYKLSQTDDVRYQELPHKEGENEYAVLLEIYNPQDDDKVLTRSDFLDFSLTWEGNNVSTTYATKADKVLSVLNGLMDIVSAIAPQKKDEGQDAEEPSATQNTYTAQETRTAVGNNSVQETRATDANNTYYGSDPELEYAMAHTNNAEANGIMEKLLASFHARIDNIEKSKLIYEESYKRNQAILDEFERQRKTGSSTRGQSSTQRGSKTPQRGGRTVRSSNGRTVTVDTNTITERMKVVNDWRDGELKKLEARVLDQEVEDKLADRYCSLLGIKQIGRSSIGCVYCHGTSICYRCNGGGASSTTNVAGLKEKCSECHGTGQCTRCKGGSKSFFDHMPDPDDARRVLMGQKATKKNNKTYGNQENYSETEVVCGYCRGSRKCYHCNGKGIVNQGTTNEHQCTVCRGKNNARCTYCDGTGKVTRKTTGQ